MQPPGVFNLTRGPDADLRLVEGADNSFTLSFDTSYGSDWSGYAARAQLRSALGGVLVGEFMAVITPDSRSIYFLLPYTVSFPSGVECGVWDCEIYNGVSVTRVVQGEWSLNREVTV